MLQQMQHSPMANQPSIPSKIKSIYLELPEYKFQHGIPSDFRFFIGREKMRERLKSILLNTERGSGGAYLVTGYRGMGKTSLVEYVVDEINKGEKKGNEPDVFIKIHISLSQDDIRDLDVLKFFATQLCLGWDKLNLQLSKISIELSIEAKKWSEDFSNRLIWLNDRLNSVVKTKREYETEPFDFPKERRNKEIIRSESLPKEIEKELISLLDLLHKIRLSVATQKINIPQFLFIIDELDKIEPSYLYDLDHSRKDLPTQTELDNIFGINKVRRRQEVIARLLANLKSFLNTAKAKFIFIGGREMYDAALADIADRDSFYSSIFHDVIYINSFFKDRLSPSRSGLTRLTEAYLCQLLLPKQYVSEYASKHPKDYLIQDENKPSEEIFNLTTYLHYLIDLLKNKDNKKYHECKVDSLSEDELQSVYKTIFFLQNTIIFLTYRSNGTPKKLVALLESYIVNIEDRKIDLLKQTNNNIILGQSGMPIEGGLSKERLYLHFSFNQQYEIGLTANIYRPYLIIHSRYLKALGDKLLYSTAYIMDYILKFHPHAFSWRHLELIPEIILVNKDPNLRYYISDILKFLSGMHIRETSNGMFMYKFYKKQANEIQLLTKVSEPASAAFHFTLDESLHIIRYYRRKLDQLKATHPNYNEEYIHSIGFIQGILGDLYYFEREYDEAIIYYTDSIQVLRRMAQQEPHKMTKHQVVLYVRNKLLLGLCLEKIKAFDSAYSIYRGLILNIPPLLESVVERLPERHVAIPPGISDDEWDKPIRRMQLFLKPNIALLDLIEKQRMDGITHANLSRNYKEIYEFLVGSTLEKHTDITIGKGIVSKKKMDSMRVAVLMSDYYANVGSLLFFKNRNFPELHELLNYHGLTNSRSSNFFQFIKSRGGGKGFTPSLSALTYYYLALFELAESYVPKLREISKVKDSKITDFKDTDNAFFKAVYLIYPESSGIINNTILFNFANMLTRLGDSLLACLSHESLNKYPLQYRTLELFSNVDLNEISFDEELYSTSEDINATGNNDTIVDKIRLIFQAQGLNTKDSSRNKNQEIRCQLSIACDINFILALYRLASLFYMKAGRTYSYAFQYKKFLFVLKDYLLCVNKDQFVSGFALSLHKDDLAIEKDVCERCENIAERIFNTATWISEVANRPQILKYREIFKYQGKDFSQEETRRIFLNLSTSAEIREVIVLTEEIKIKVKRLLDIRNKSAEDLKSHISPYDLVTNRFTRVHELRYQSEVNYVKLNLMGIDVVLKSPIITDLEQLNPLQGSEVLKRIGDTILRDTEKISLKEVLGDLVGSDVLHNKISNIEQHIQYRLKSAEKQLGRVSNSRIFIKNVKKLFPEFYLSDKRSLAYKDILQPNVEQIICDSIFALFEVIRVLNLYGINYISNHSFLANIHFKLANWCQIAANYDVIKDYFQKPNHPKSQTLRDLLKNTLGEEDIHYLEPNYHNELAIQHYYSALQTHTGGNAYKSINQSMSFLEDDFNDNLTHFSAASERFRINTGLVNKKINDLKRKIINSNLYSYKNYLDGW